MKILQLFNPYLHFGGEESAFQQISIELEKSHDLETIVFNIDKWAEATDFLSKVKQVFLMAANPDSIRLVREKIRNRRPDVILLHNIMPVGSAALYLYLSRCGIPVIHYIHNFRPFSVNGYCWGNGQIISDGLYTDFRAEIRAASWQESRLKTAYYAFLIKTLHAIGVYRKMAGWIAISSFMKDAFIKGGIAGEKIATIPHSLDPGKWEEVFTNSVPFGAPPQFLFLGRISEEKGVRTLLEAWEIYRAKGGKGVLRIAGEGPLDDEVAARCESLEGAEFIGFTSGEEKARLLASCTAMIVPSVWWEPLGLVLYEAYSFGKPVLAARSGGIVDHVTDGETGWIHEPGNAKQLAEHIEEAAESPEECRLRGLKGREGAERLNPSVWIAQFDSFMNQTVGSFAKPEKIFADRKIKVRVYLADQNPGYDRSFGISRMSHMILASLKKNTEVAIETVVSKTSERGPDDLEKIRQLPWGTRSKTVRLLSDHLHPILLAPATEQNLHYFPKGYLPLMHQFCTPSVVTIHDTIIQHYEDKYPEWRDPLEYAYWAKLLRHTLRKADRILTVSQFSKNQILEFMERHGIKKKEIIVTYEPCFYESIQQPPPSIKKNNVIHLASPEPHKRTEDVVRWWNESGKEGRELPTLELIGNVSKDLRSLIEQTPTIVTRAIPG